MRLVTAVNTGVTTHLPSADDDTRTLCGNDVGTSAAQFTFLQCAKCYLATEAGRKAYERNLARR